MILFRQILHLQDNLLNIQYNGKGQIELEWVLHNNNKLDKL